MMAPQNLHLGRESMTCFADSAGLLDMTVSAVAFDSDPIHEMQIRRPTMAMTPPISCKAAPKIATDSIHGT